jgi:hypothetical protein
MDGDWNIIIEDNKYDEMKDRLEELEEENRILKEKNKLLKKQLENSKIFLNKNLFNLTTQYDYLDKKPFYLNYKYRFDNTYVPNYYPVNNYTINMFEDFTALKEQYIPISKYLQ